MLQHVGAAAVIPSNQFAEAAKLSRVGLDKALRSNRIFAVELAGASHVPAFFLEVRYQPRHLGAVSRILGDLPGGSKLQFFMTPKGSLGGQTPLEALADRKFAAVRRTAQGFAER